MGRNFLAARSTDFNHHSACAFLGSGLPYLNPYRPIL